MKNPIPSIFSLFIKKQIISLLSLLLLLHGLYAQKGVLDSTFGVNGKVKTFAGNNAEINAMVLQSNGKIVVAGQGRKSTNVDFAVARYTSAGVLDNSFGTNGYTLIDFKTSTDIAHSLVVLSDGSIILVGNSYTSLGNDDIAIVKIKPNGIIDSSFGTNGRILKDIATHQDYGYGAVLQSDKKIVIAGTYKNVNTEIVVLRLNPNGTFDSTFGNNGLATKNLGTGNNGGANAVGLQADGKIVIAGSLNNGTITKPLIARYNTNGTIDSTFGTNGITVTAETTNTAFTSMAIQTDDKIACAGATTISGELVFAVMRFTKVGQLDNTFGTSGRTNTALTSSTNFGRAIKIQPNGSMVVCGEVLTTSNYDFGIVRYTGSGTLDTTFSKNNEFFVDFDSVSNLPTALEIQSDGKILIAGYIDSFGRQYFALSRYIPGIPTKPTNGVKETRLAHAMIYPNPAQNTLNIYISGEQKQNTYHIYSVTGEVLYNGQFIANKGVINVESLKSGVYFLQIHNLQGMNTIRFLKE